MYESPLNYEKKCLCVLCLDMSGSMYGESIDKLIKGLRRFQLELLQDEVTKVCLEVGIVVFGSHNTYNGVEVIQEPTPLTEFEIPHLQAGQFRPMLGGIQAAIDMVYNRTNYYKKHGLSYYRPWIILMTNGYPTDDHLLSLTTSLGNDIQKANKDKDFCFLPIGLRDCIDEELMKSLAQAQFPCMILDEYKIIEFFKWLSDCMSSLIKSSGGTITLADPSDWLSYVIE